MNLRHPLFRFLAVYLAVSLASLAPIASFQQAAFAVGLKTVLVGGLVGGAALLALGALAGPASAIGAAGCAGTGFLGTLGGAIGAAVSGVTGICAAMGTMALGSLSTLGLMVGGAIVGVIGLGLSPWLVVPALALGAGLFAWQWFKSGRYSPTYSTSNRGTLNTPIVDAGSRLADQPASQGSLADRVRSVFDTNRRDDSIFWNNRYVDSNGLIRQGNDFFNRLDQFFNGRNSGVAGNQSIYGNQVLTSRTGTVATGQAGTVGRTTLQPYAPSSTATSDDLVKAQEARKAAYEKLIQAMKSSQDSPAAPGASALTSDEVQQAIRSYKEADRAVKEITGRLQANEKQ